MNKTLKLQKLSEEVEKGLTYDELIELRKKVYNVKTEMYSEEWYEKQTLLKCLKEFIDESKPTIEQEEQKILKKFEEIEFDVITNDNKKLEFAHRRLPLNITINKEFKWYGSYTNDITSITMQEHQLLHKLFELWGWFNE